MAFMTKILRSQARFGGLESIAFIHSSRIKNERHPDDGFDGRPVIGHQRLCIDHLMQADQGADFNFRLGGRGCAAPYQEGN